MNKTAIVLAGGGSRGAYQIGVWKALREMGIDYQEEGVYDNLDADFEVSATDDYSENKEEF